MKRGELTKEKILEKAAGLFNSRGYFGASMSDLMAATGLEKGGIYNHFKSKDELALAAFDYAVGVNAGFIREAVQKHQSSSGKLEAFLEAFNSLAKCSPIPGGCPLLNGAIECDDAHPEMKEKVEQAIEKVRSALSSIIEDGQKSGEFKADLKASHEATIIFAAIEGALMLSRLNNDETAIKSVISHLKAHIKSFRTDHLKD